MSRVDAYEMDQRDSETRRHSEISVVVPTSPSPRPDKDAHQSGAPLQFDPDFRGPLEKRSCTDILCCFIFAAFLFLWTCIAAVAIKYGNPEKIIHPTDSSGRLCGVNVTDRYNFSDRPYVLFFDMTKCISYATAFEGCPTKQVCVKKCPDYYFSYLEVKALEELNLNAALKSILREIRSKVVCASEELKNGLKTTKDLERAVMDGDCAAYIVASVPVLGRCIPKLIVNLGQTILNESSKVDNLTRAAENAIIPTSAQLGDAKNFVKLMLDAKKLGEKIYGDLEKAWWQIIIFLFISAFVSFAWIVLMRWISGPMVWLSMILVVLIFAAASAFSWWRYFFLRDAADTVEWKVTLRFESYYYMKETWLASGIVCSVIFLIIFFILCFLWSRVRIAIAMIKESSKALVQIISALFFPVVPFLLQLVVFACWATVAVYLSSWSKPNCRNLEVQFNEMTPWLNFTNGSQCDCEKAQEPNTPFCTFVNFTSDSNFVLAAQATNLFFLFWMLFFVGSLADLTLAGAFASYYWAFHKPQDMPTLPILRGFWRAIRYHIGSLAFGSLILAVVRFIRAVLEYLDSKLKQSESPVAKFLLKCLKCCCFCLEKVLKFLTKNAFIMMAIHGGSFCKSAKDSFMLLMRNLVRVWVIDKVTDFLLFLGKVVVTGGVGVMAFYFFSGEFGWNEEFVRDLSFPLLPVAVVVIGSFLICCAFFSVYEMAVDTTFLCFLEDCERNDGSAQKPYFMSKNLMKILDKRNEFSLEKRN